MSIIENIKIGDFEGFKKDVLKNRRNLKIFSKRLNMGPFEYAVHNDRVDMVEWLLDSQGELGMGFNHARHGGKPMMSAVKSVAMAKLLIKYDFEVQPEYSANIISEILNYWSSIKDMAGLIQFLVNNGASLEVDSNNWSPFMNAVAGNQIEVMDILYKAGANINFKDWNGRRAVDIVPKQVKTIQKLLIIGPDLSDKNLDFFGEYYPELLSVHPHIDKYLDYLMEKGYDKAIPFEIRELFVF